MTSAFVTSTSPYTCDWNAPESVMTAPGNPRNLWMPSRTIASRSGDFPRMYALVIRICAPNRAASSRGGMIGRFGLMTGASVGVVTEPCAVSRTPIRASPSRSRTSNMRGHPARANKVFRRLRAPPRKDYLSRAGFAGADVARDVRPHPRWGYRTEERLWRSGIRTWDDFAETSKPRRLPTRVAHRIADEIARSDEALRR